MGYQRLDFAISGDQMDKLPFSTWQLLSTKGFSERKSVSCVGFCRDTEQNTLCIVFPKVFSDTRAIAKLDDPRYLREQMFRLIRLLSRIARETQYSTEYVESDIQSIARMQRSDPVLDSLEAALSLRQEYRRNGLYYCKRIGQRENVYNMPINWHRTISRRPIVLNSEHEFLIPQTIHNVRMRDKQNFLYRLHIQCLQEIFALIGERDDINRYEGLSSTLFQVVKRDPRLYLRMIRQSIYDDRGRRLLLMIEAYLNESRLGRSSRTAVDSVLGYTSVFENIWEYILRSVFGTQFDHSKRTLPAGCWIGFPEKQKGTGIEPKIDIRFRMPGHEILLDAKDYRILDGACLGTSGSAADHYKQIIYNRLIEKKESEEFINILAFPGIEQTSLFQLRGCHYWENMDDSLVFEITIDYDRIVKHWMGEEIYDIHGGLQRLVDQIKDMP